MAFLATSFEDLAIGKIKSLINIYIDKQYEYQTTDVKAKLKHLSKGLMKIEALVAAAQNTGNKEPSLLEWLSNLRDAIYDAEYVMDVFEYRRLEKEIQSWSSPQETKADSKGRTNKKVLDLLKFPSSSCFNVRSRATTFAKRLIFADEELNDLLEVVKKFDSLVADIPEFASVFQLHQTNKFIDNQQVGASINQGGEILETTSVPNEAVLFGRNEADQKLRKLLLQSSYDRETRTFSVLSIVGVGGVGKSTLAQSVFNDQEVMAHFSMRAWVCVSTNFSIKNLMIRIIESANIQKPPDLHSHIGLDSIVAALRKGLHSKKFLIVLDDVWEDMQGKWDDIAKALNCGEQGSRIIVTTRSSNVAQAMGVQEKMTLNPLNSEDFWALFQKCAFGNKTPESYPKLKRIAEQIANQLGGLPLAAKTMGATLQNNFSIEHWKGILASKAWKERHDKSIMSALKLSYDHLPVHLKKCFVYCSVFPKDYKYNEKVLLDIWIALDCVKSTDVREKRLADIKREYIDELVSRCFLEKGEDYGNNIYYVIHDLLHDLAEAAAGDEVYRIEDDESLSKPIPSNVRHLYIKANSDVSMNAALQKFAPKQLRSLVYFTDGEESKLQMTKETEKILKGLRFLYFDCPRNDDKLMLSENLGDLIHLRCIYIYILNVWSSRVGDDLVVLPKSLSKLYQLQILHWPVRMRFRVKLLSYIDKLINLRHVDSTWCGFDVAYSKSVDVDNSDMLTSYIGHLKNLEVIPDGEYRIDGKEGKDIGQLGELHNIGGTLKLRVSTKLSKEEIRKANLNRKEYIAGLSIIVEEGGDFDDDAIEHLQPHENLEKLEISGCRGINKPPTWLSMLSNLEHLILEELPNMQEIPADLGRLLFLKYLKLCNLPSVRQIDVVDSPGDVNELFPSLICIAMVDMEILEGWSIPSHNSCNKTYFPKLSHVAIRNCPKFRKIGDSPEYSVPFCSQLFNCSLELYYVRSSFFPFRKTGWMSLYVDEWPFVTEYHPAILQRLFSSLKKLEIGGHDNLKSLPAILQELSSLETLEIKDCKQLESLEGNKDNTHQLPLESQGSTTNSHHFFPSSIKKLCIHRCSELKYLCTTSLQTVSSLEVLEINSCNQLESLVNNKDDDQHAHLPPSIKTLQLRRCDKLKIPVASFQMLSSLKTVEIDNCEELEKTLLLAAGKQNVAVEELGRFPVGCLGALSSLKTLAICNCDNLKSLPASLHALSCLETLEIRECKQLESLEPNESTHHLSLGSSTNSRHFFPPSIKKLYIKNCHNLKFLCTTSLQTVSSLEVLHIENCNKLESLVNNKDDDDHAHLPHSIKELSLRWCMQLKIPVASFQMLSSLETLRIDHCKELERMLQLAAGQQNVPVEQLGRTLFPSVKKFDFFLQEIFEEFDAENNLC